MNEKNEINDYENPEILGFDELISNYSDIKNKIKVLEIFEKIYSNEIKRLLEEKGGESIKGSVYEVKYTPVMKLDSDKVNQICDQFKINKEMLYKMDYDSKKIKDMCKKINIDYTTSMTSVSTMRINIGRIGK